MTTKPDTSTEAARAILDGLKKPTGKVANGPTLSKPTPHKRRINHTAAPVLVKRPAIHIWFCDVTEKCKESGYGLPALMEHFTKTGHRVYVREEDRVSGD